MLTVTIVNTGTHPRRPEYGSYEFSVAINRKVIAHGWVDEHERRRGWRQLVQLVIEQANDDDADQVAACGPREARLREAEPIVVTQRENGCYAACVASLTGIPLDDLPHPSPDEEFTREAWTTYRNTLNRFLRERGWWRAWIPADTPPLGYAIAHGDGPRGMGHCCVSRGNAIVMDPHPNGGGLVSVEGYEVLVRCAALASPPPDDQQEAT